MKKKFYRFKEIGPLGLESCDILTEDFLNKWGEKDNFFAKRNKTQDIEKLEDSEQELEVREIEENLYGSFDDRIFTLEIALRIIAGGSTRDKRFKGLSVTEIAVRALRLSKELEIKD